MIGFAVTLIGIIGLLTHSTLSTVYGTINLANATTLRYSLRLNRTQVQNSDSSSWSGQFGQLNVLFPNKPKSNLILTCDELQVRKTGHQIGFHLGCASDKSQEMNLQIKLIIKVVPTEYQAPEQVSIVDALTKHQNVDLSNHFKLIENIKSFARNQASEQTSTGQSRVKIDIIRPEHLLVSKVEYGRLLEMTAEYSQL